VGDAVGLDLVKHPCAGQLSLERMAADGRDIPSGNSRGSKGAVKVASMQTAGAP
jgi:hypothetical protein